MSNFDPDRFRKQFKQQIHEKEQATTSALALAEEEGFREGYARVTEIVDLCIIAGEAHLAGDFLRREMMPADVKSELISMGKWSGKLSGNPMSKADLERNPMVMASEKMVQEVKKHEALN